MKLPNILLLIVLLSNNYVISQTSCPQNGIKTTDGNCFYLSKKDCPPPWKETIVPENDADYAIISDLLHKTQTKERVCMWIHDPDIEKILNRQPKYIKKLRDENKILLDKPIQNDESLHIAFKRKNNNNPLVITIQDSSRDEIYFCKIEMIITKKDNNYEMSMMKVSVETEVKHSFDPLPPSECNGFYELDIRFTNDKLHIIDSAERETLIQFDLSLNSKYSADMVSIKNMEVYQLEHHDIKCQGKDIYCPDKKQIVRNNEPYAKYCYSDYWVPEITTKVPYQSDCGTEAYLNICRMKNDLQKKPNKSLSHNSSICEEQIEKLQSSIDVSRKNLPKLSPITIVVPCCLFGIGLILNLVNVIFEYVQREKLCS